MKLWRWWQLLLICGGVSAETLHLPFGPEQSKLGVYIDGDYVRGPFGVSLASDGTLWVADSYKGRLARFSRTGVYQGELPMEAVSPRMTLFQKQLQGFITVGDQTVSWWKNDASPGTRIPLGLALPDAMWANDRRVFALFSDGVSSFCMAWDEAGTPTRSSLRRGASETAVIQDGHPWLPRWADQKKLFRWKASVADDARLLAWTEDVRSLWIDIRQERGTAWWVRPDGTSGQPVFFSNVRSQGTSVSASPTLDLVVSRWTADALEVEIIAGQK